jgi:PII-like signaling protein
MSRLEGEAMVVRIFLGESDTWEHRPLALALVERLREEGFAGATVLRGIAGFGARSVLHTAHVLRLSEDLPVVVEVVEREDRLDDLHAILDEMVQEGLVTCERVTVWQYRAR